MPDLGSGGSGEPFLLYIFEKEWPAPYNYSASFGNKNLSDSFAKNKNIMFILTK